MYSWYLFFHLVGVAMLFAAIGIEIAVLFGVLRAASIEQVRAATYFEPILPKLFPISAGVLLVFGMLLVSKYKHDSADFGEPYVDLGLGLLVLLAILGAGVQGRRMEAIHEAAQEGSGALTVDLAARINDPVLRFSTLISVAVAVDIVWLMTKKPEWGAAWLSLVIAVAVGAALAALVSQFIPTASAAQPRT